MSIDNHIRRLAQQSQQEAISVRVGTVTGYDPESYKATVQLQPTGETTGWLPVSSIWIGNQWGIFCPPSIGDEVEVHFHDHDTNDGVIALRFYNSVDRPVSVPSGEFLLKHASGSLMHFFNDGQVKLVSAGTLTSEAPQWNHTGPVQIDGTVLITGDTEIQGNETVQGKISGNGGMGIKGGGGGAAVTVEGDVGVSGGNVVADGIGLKTHVHTEQGDGNNVSQPK